MPYIKQEERKKFDNLINEIVKKLKESDEKDIDGNLDYIVTKILKAIYQPKYFNYNRAIGVLECIKQEFYRRNIAPYEDKKIKENGDVE